MTQPAARLHDRHRQRELRAASVRAARRGARHGAARDGPLAVGLPEHAASSIRTASARYTWKPMGDFELRTTAGANYTSQRVRTTQARRERPRSGRRSRERRLGVLAPRRLDIELRTLGFYGSRKSAWRRPAVPHRRRSLRRVVDVRAVGALAGVPEVLGVVRASIGESARAWSTTSVLRSALGWAGSQPGIRQRVLAVHHVRAAAVCRPAGLRQRRHVRQPESAQRARARVGGRHGGRLPRRPRRSRGDVLQPPRLRSVVLPSSRDEHRLLASVPSDRVDVEQGHRADAEHDERRARRTSAGRRR